MVQNPHVLQRAQAELDDVLGSCINGGVRVGLGLGSSPASGPVSSSAIQAWFQENGPIRYFNNEFSAQRAQTHGDDRDIESTATSLGDLPEGSKYSGAPIPAAEFEVTQWFSTWMGRSMLYVLRHGKPQATITPDYLRRFVRDVFMDMHVMGGGDRRSTRRWWTIYASSGMVRRPAITFTEASNNLA
ncbi:hypothetical protein EDB19DRAFT_1916588 [Suillus lakei]|nr:hypothetical protein EDB19DRAFT_1916588 [Suillus lakei]